jgi:spore coat polysaccharide biosynthesis protein SpsF
MSALPDHPRISIITQARMTSSRLPGKVMCEVAGKSMLLHHIERLRKNGHSVIIATTMNPEDDVIDSFALTHSIPCYRGDEHDVLGRFYHANQMFPSDIIVRVTSDCPLIDSELIQRGIEKYTIVAMSATVFREPMRAASISKFSVRLCWKKHS